MTAIAPSRSQPSSSMILVEAEGTSGISRKSMIISARMPDYSVYRILLFRGNAGRTLRHVAEYRLKDCCKASDANLGRPIRPKRGHRASTRNGVAGKKEKKSRALYNWVPSGCQAVYASVPLGDGSYIPGTVSQVSGNLRSTKRYFSRKRVMA